MSLEETPHTPARTELEEIQEAYPIEAITEALAQPSSHTLVLGAADGFRAAFLTDLAKRGDRTLVVLTETAAQARALAEDLSLFSDPRVSEQLTGPRSIAHYPEFDVGPYHRASADRQVAMQRLSVLWALRSETPPSIVVSSVASAMRKTLPPTALEENCHVVRYADTVDNDTLRRWFADCGYSEVVTVEDPGTFSIRGDIVDVFPPGLDCAVRIERWGDDVSELRAFDPATQRTIEEVSECPIMPVREEILDADHIRRARDVIRGLADEIGTPTREVSDILDDLAAGLHFIGIDALLPAMYDQLGGLLDYLPERSATVLIEPDDLLARLRDLRERREVEYAEVREEGALVFEPSHYYRSEAELLDVLAERSVLDLRRLAIAGDGGYALPPDARRFELKCRVNTDVIALRKQHRGVEETIAAISELLPAWKQRHGRVCFACRTHGQVERLVNLLEARGEVVFAVEPPLDVSEFVPPPAGALEVYRANLSAGFRSELLGVAVVAGSEIFGQRVATRAGHDFAEQVSISHFRDLAPGDLIVHVDFGIGRYQGLKHFEVEGIGNDFLHLEYAGQDKLYLPVYKLGRVQKYVGSPDGIRLDKLGGTTWEKTKERVKRNIREVASDLLELYARRELRKGHAFTEPDAFYHEFEADFPFEETPDQQRAIDEVLEDMTRTRPMDRLVCGDVGFGKTEVAIRAAMKAVADGKQVAVLVPTTILCEQHITSFRRRLAAFGVSVEGLSRFRSTKQTREVIEATGLGKVDVLIGTHRLLSEDIAFRDLGLLIVDEEQRFGVQHKERIKKLKANVDVLTLSATPIPRTLQMSLLGIRDLSIIATPPHDRLAVRTHVAKFNDNIVREAIMREISRGGQVFFVHNRVASIDEMAEHLRKIVPEARIVVGHGQMAEAELEKVMVSYIQGESHVLLCSSIIESGLDIPNANTIIVNRADMFGLSQLYQLRGRVGRGKERAFAYLLIPARTRLKAEAEKRLEVIQTYTELGSGFQVATYDLEIRGAGSLLGEDQSGHVTAVGLDLYTELLEEAIDEMRGLEHTRELDPEVNIPIEAFIPEEYVAATSLRLMFYKRFSMARTADELFETFGEMKDRFGEPPESVKNLRAIIGLKVGLREIRAPRLDVGPSSCSVELDASTPIRPDRLVEWMKSSRGRVRLTKDMKVVYSLLPHESARPLEAAKEVLKTLFELR